jgi:hypothetical protein
MEFGISMNPVILLTKTVALANNKSYLSSMNNSINELKDDLLDTKTLPGST